MGLIQGVVAGIAHYGNPVGVPTVEVRWPLTSYSGNQLVMPWPLG